MEGYTKKQIQHAARARCLKGMIAAPSERDFQAMIRHNYLKDCPVTNDDIKNAHDKYGSDLITIRGKTVHTKLERDMADYIETL